MELLVISSIFICISRLESELLTRISFQQLNEGERAVTSVFHVNLVCDSMEKFNFCISVVLSLDLRMCFCNSSCYSFLNYIHYCLNHASNPLVKQILIKLKEI
jgi:hypothetical protein